MKIEKDHTLLKHTLGLQPSEVAIYFYEIFDRNYIGKVQFFKESKKNI